MTCLGTTELSKKSQNRDSFADLCEWFLPSNAPRKSIKFQKFTRVCLPRVYTSVREKKKRTLKKRSENRRVLSIRAHMYAESCGPSSPASAGFPRSFSRLDLSLPSLSLSLRFFSFSSSWGQNRDHASPSFPFFGVVHSLASPPHIFSRLRRSPAKFHDGFDLRYNAILLTVPTIAISKT